MTSKNINLEKHADQIELCEKEMNDTNVQTPEKSTNPLDKFSLRGMSQEIEKQIMEEVHVLSEIALLGQLAALYDWFTEGFETEDLRAVRAVVLATYVIRGRYTRESAGTPATWAARRQPRSYQTVIDSRRLRNL